MTTRSAARLGWGGLALTSALVVGAIVLAAIRGSADVPEYSELGVGDVIAGIVLALGFSAFGTLIVRRHASHATGWLFGIAGLSFALSWFAEEYAVRAILVDPGSLPAGDAAAWLSAWMWIGLVPMLGTVGLLLFPTGRLPSARWRPVLWASIAVIGALVLGFAFVRGELADFPIENPLGFLPGGVEVAGAVLIPTVIVCLASIVVRYRRARGDERQQLRWMAVAAAGFVATLLVAGSVEAATGADVWWILEVGTAGLIAAAAIAILKYRLYDLDLVVNRTLAYGALTGVVVAAYVGVVSGLGELLDSSGIGISIVATAAVAVAIQPLRAVIQRRVDRLMYGDRDDPYRALSRLGERLGQALDPDAVLPTVVVVIAEGLRLPYVAIELAQAGGRRIVASHGKPRGPELARLPLEYRGKEVGRLLAAPRPGSDALGPADLALLADLARQAGVAAHAVALANDLRRSRERLVAAREEERRRLRRDLHDGLGPSLAGIALEIESARALVERDPGAARELLGRLQGEVQESIADIRRIAHDLRPPTLDELGLVAAVSEHAARLMEPAGGGASANGLWVSVDGPETLPPLPAAVEVAAYRIALEALTNVSRHADAQSCTVTIEVNGVLKLEVRDDGRGVAGGDGRGVGLVSMRERAEELGGSLTVGRAMDGRGTRVLARLPLEGR
jgi:two-component system NarL family sensor kinase